MVAFTQHDLQFILDGIIVSESHADQTNDVVADPTLGDVWLQADIYASRVILRCRIPNSLEPIGMRTIDGELNNLEPGQDQFGGTGNEFPRLTDEDHRDDGALPPDGTGDGTGNPADSDGIPLGPPGPGTPVVDNTDYAQSSGPSFPEIPGPVANGDVVDSDPRIISNLIVDQSVRNPAAIAGAGFDPEDFDVASVLAACYDAGDDGLIGTDDDVGLDDGTLIIDFDDPNGTFNELSGNEFFFIPNTAPDEGLSAPFNAWMTFFGQFFDHGLDLIQKGGSGTIFMPLQPDDPLITLGPDGVAGTGDEVSPSMAFIPLTRATVDPGPDGVLGINPLTGINDDVRGPENFTSPHVDQNQTYTSHPSHQLFVREYVLDDLGPGERPFATGALIEGAGGGMATWGDVKAQAEQMLGIELTDAEALDIPLFAVDQYGEFIPGANGLPQYVLERPDGMGGVETTLIEGDLGDPVSVAEAEALAAGIDGGGWSAVGTKFAFLLDIAHNAAPTFFDDDSNPLTPDVLNPDADGDIGSIFPPNPPGSPYDDELLDAHFIAGDGRANENIALTAVHHVFHQEHNRLVEHTKVTLLAAANPEDLSTAGDPDGGQATLDLINGYLLTPLTAQQEMDLATLRAGNPTEQDFIDFADTLVWDGDRLFQAAKFGTEMQYQHLVFEEFARKVQPLVDIFASFEPSI
ncbi:MAG: peroxidase family protein, partial [Methyloligellaceae bacterium]